MSSLHMNQENAEVDDDETKKEIKKVTTATDLQRHKLEKLLKQPDKPVFIPDRPKERKMPKPPEFIRNTWGSSAGAGSGDFHVYRGVRRREYARQKFLNEQESKKSADDEYQQKLEANAKAAEEKTAKKRAKRLKKKQKAKQQKKSGGAKPQSSDESEEEEEEITEDGPALTSENSTAKQTDLNNTPSEYQTAADQEQTITNTANINDTVEEADDDR